MAVFLLGCELGLFYCWLMRGFVVFICRLPFAYTITGLYLLVMSFFFLI